MKDADFSFVISLCFIEGAPAYKVLFSGGAQANNFLFSGRPLATKFLFSGGPPANNLFLLIVTSPLDLGGGIIGQCCLPSKQVSK